MPDRPRRPRPWRLLLLAWLSLGCGIGTAQGPALGMPVRVPKAPAPARPRQQPAQGVWGPWGPWSSCSSSCGDGVALRARRCLRSTEDDTCTDDPRQYRLCQLQGCPGSSVPFRAMQCSLYDNKPLLGTSAQYRWVPFHGAPNVCDLNCLAVGHNFYYTFGRVLDGTRCGPGSPDLCVGGRCLSVGCDGILGSGTQPDACGQCSGGHDTCLFVHRLFQGADPSSGSFGYMNVTKIPAGATHIKVTDKSHNYLALMTSDGHYVLNGDWSIAWPGPYEVAGTWLHYTRAPDGTESLEAPGPTDQDLHVMVLLQEPNPGIEYEFWLPRGHPQPRRVFQGRILAQRLVGQETRYEVEVKTPYRHRFPLVRREYVWVPNTCGCPSLREGSEYLLMARRHVNYEHTLNRILLQDDGYARPWTPREDRLEGTLVCSSVLAGWQQGAVAIVTMVFQGDSYKIFIFTTAKQKYADKVLDVLYPKKQLIRHCLSQWDCICTQGCLGRDLAKMVALDHPIQGFSAQVPAVLPLVEGDSCALAPQEHHGCVSPSMASACPLSPGCQLDPSAKMVGRPAG
ncbi:ADAMTS-like protein 5 [Grus japonensis]|uniref:ADAMTS-like protein 5 n=1 Tax=Grus japonensis TaxID=30415 RepID=A0ABC9XU71_GRUJA